MKNQVLSIDQCKELLELGIDMSGATMCWYELGDGYVLCNDATLLSGYFSKIPTFTLQDIMNILFEVTYKLKDNQYFILSHMGVTIENEGFEGSYTIKSFDGLMLDSAFEALKWCKTNKYI